MPFQTKFLSVVLLLIGLVNVPTQAQKTKKHEIQRPKLVVGIVVDQMRADYVYRFAPYYGEGGFKRFLSQGYNCRNTHYNYVPTYTGPGHAAIYTGSVPAYNGIISNDWYDREWGKMRYVVSDPTVEPVGTQASTGKMSPASLLSTTVTDELRLSNNKQSKVIGVCIKDRGSVLPAGHMPNAAYWFDNVTGNWVTSSYYMKELPNWVKQFNDKKTQDTYLSEDWNTLHPISQYNLGLKDGDDYRHNFKTETDGKFPHKVAQIFKEEGYNLLRKIPAGNTFTLDFALQALENEKMGKGTHTDFLALSFSTPDYVGHQFGINSIEIQDCYARLDRDLERLFTYLDKNYGMDNVLVFLSADHGGAQTPAYLKANGIPAGFFPDKGLKKELNTYLEPFFGKGDWVEDYGSLQIYLNYKLIEEKKINTADIIEKLRMNLKQRPGVQEVWDVYQIEKIGSPGTDVRQRLLNGIHSKRSGDIAILLQPAWFAGDYAYYKGTTHGSAYTYDTHVPLLWLGWRIKKGETSRPTTVSDIAPTVSDLLSISQPSASIGLPLTDLITK